MIIVLGSMLAAYGITLALYAGFGGATLAIVWQGMSKTFHISIGMASLIVALIMIVFVFFYDRSHLVSVGVQFLCRFICRCPCI